VVGSYKEKKPSKPAVNTQIYGMDYDSMANSKRRDTNDKKVCITETNCDYCLRRSTVQAWKPKAGSVFEIKLNTWLEVVWLLA